MNAEIITYDVFLDFSSCFFLLIREKFDDTIFASKIREINYYSIHKYYF